MSSSKTNTTIAVSNLNAQTTATTAGVRSIAVPRVKKAAVKAVAKTIGVKAVVK
ncbi:hypothetical protein Q9L58_009737 [Maublancomyces gigas]|uniref:Uncharacterized protein n=1 Tax=Discina gigas TaxID=1032678 RepID=A0ABR3G6K0_9PEZI